MKVIIILPIKIAFFEWYPPFLSLRGIHIPYRTGSCLELRCEFPNHMIDYIIISRLQCIAQKYNPPLILNMAMENNIFPNA